MANKWNSYSFSSGTVISSPYLNDIVSRMTEVVSVKDFGAVGDNNTNDTVAIQTALDTLNANGGILVFPPGTYVVTSILNVHGTSGIILYGFGATIKTNQQVLLEFDATTSNCTIQGINFLSTEVSGAGTLGLITGNNEILTNIHIKDCTFTASTSATNAIKFVQSSAGKELRGFTFENNVVSNIGQMGVEIINHTDDDTARYFDVRIINNRFINLGLASTFGQAVSLSGYGNNCVFSNNTIEAAKDIAIELIGSEDTTISGNTVRNLTASCTGILVKRPDFAAVDTTKLVIDGNTIVGNSGFAAQIMFLETGVFSNNSITGTGKVSFESCNNTTISGNNVKVENTILFDNCVGMIVSGNRFECLTNTSGYNPTIDDTTLSIFTGNLFKSGRSTGLLLSGTTSCTNNILVGNIFSNIDSPVGGPALQFSGAVVTGNAVVAPIFMRTTAGGNPWVQSSSAAGNTLSLPKSNVVNPSAGDTYSSPLSLFTGANNYLHTITLGAYHLWVDNTGDLRIKSSAPTGDTDGTVVGTQT